LGKGDPGHVELRNASASFNEFVEGIGVNGSSPRVPANGQQNAQTSQLAQVAHVAAVSQVSIPRPARVATIANVASVSLASASTSRTQQTVRVETRGRDANPDTRNGDQREHRGPAMPAPDPTTGNL